MRGRSDQASLAVSCFLLALMALASCSCEEKNTASSSSAPPTNPGAVPPAVGSDSTALLKRARSFHESGNFIEALPLYQEVLKLQPKDAAVLESLGLCQSALGEEAAGLDSLRRALALNPRLVVANNEVAWMLATDPALASELKSDSPVPYAERAVALTNRRNTNALGTLAAAQAAMGDFPNAIRTATDAREMAVAQNEPEIARDLAKQMAEYRKNSPWRVERAGRTSVQLVEERRQLDETAFAAERAAQNHEAAFVSLWDELLAKEPEQAFEVLGKFEFAQLAFATPGPAVPYDAGISGINFRSGSETRKVIDPAEFRGELASLQKTGWRIVETEWHHAAFNPESESAPARSTISAVLHGEKQASSTRVILRATLQVSWVRSEGKARAGRIDVLDYKMIQRSGTALFKPLLTIDPRKDAPQARPMVLPLIIRDLDQNGLPEIVAAGCNLVYWNRGKGIFEAKPFLAHPVALAPAGLMADFSGDGIDDFISVGGAVPRLWLGSQGGIFSGESVICFAGRIPGAQAMTAGDVDGDGDLDLFIGQYLRPYLGGQMPTPWYDANDGLPAFLLLNDGAGSFRDGTAAARLNSKRRRRSYSASFVDLDQDHDLDLLVVSDFAGLDVYLNDGAGVFADVSESLVDERHSFGMSHAVDDFDGDGRLDFYMTGMGSTTARRLEKLGLNRPGQEVQSRLRMPMGFGNRMYLRSGDRFTAPAWKNQVARSGWSWGCSSSDFDNDGDVDLYIANGHISGKTTQDYCTRFWCHDIYTGVSKPDAALNQLFLKELGPTQRYEASWNGYEHNALFLNRDNEEFVNVGFLAGVGFEFDSRGVASADFDQDGRMDLLVSRHASDGTSDRHEVHVLRNTMGEDGGNWIGLRLESSPGKPALGAVVSLHEIGGRVRAACLVNGDSFCTQQPEDVHFGLGTKTEVEKIVVAWPDGSESTLMAPAINRYHQQRRP